MSDLFASILTSVRILVSTLLTTLLLLNISYIEWFLIFLDFHKPYLRVSLAKIHLTTSLCLLVSRMKAFSRILLLSVPLSFFFLLQ